MQKIKTFAVVVLLAFLINTVFSQPKKSVHTDSVYFCYSVSVDLYHRSANCKSLDKCKQLIKIAQPEAENKYHRKPCRYCVSTK